MIRTARDRPDTNPMNNRRKTNHVTRACNTCRRKKSRCDGNRPICKSCADSGHECTWTAEEDSRRPATKQYVESLKNTNKVLVERIATLEAVLAQHNITSEATAQVTQALGQSHSNVQLGLHGIIPQPTSNNHSPAGSFTIDLPADPFLSPGGIDGSYDNLSDSESVAESLSNATARLMLADGDLSVHGPSSTLFHRPAPPSPTPRIIPLEDAPKHKMYIEGGEEPPRSHSRHPSVSHARSRSQSQTRSPAHSRTSSISAPGISPPNPPNFGATSPPVPTHFSGLSPGPPMKASPNSPYNFADAPSPASDISGNAYGAHVDESPFDNGSFTEFAPSTRYGHTLQVVADDMIDDGNAEGYDWQQYLPDVEITRVQHDTALDTFFTFFSSWGYRTISDLFLRDMRQYLEITKNNPIEYPHSPLDEKGLVLPPKLVHYTPMLHNAILAIALAYSDVPFLARRSTRALFIDKAKDTLEFECARPSLACVQALSYIASFYSGEGSQTLGFLYFGMSVRMSQALGLSLDCSSWVRSGHITPADEIERVWTFWSTYCIDKCWAFYVGRDLGLPTPLLRQSPAQSSESFMSGTASDTTSPTGSRTEICYPQVDPKVDNTMWDWKQPGIGSFMRRSAHNVPSGMSSAFFQTCKLMVLATKIMHVTWRRSGSEAVAHTALELDAWLEELPDSMRITRPKSTTALPHVLMINMAHQWLQIILHRPFYRGMRAKDPSVKRCDSGAEKILQYLAAWRRLYELRFVPITAVQIAFVAGTTCLLRAIQSANMPEKRKGALEGVKEIVRCLNEMGRTWQSASQSASALRTLLKEQVSASERSPVPSRQPTLELHPPSVAGSRAASMDMMFDMQQPVSRSMSGMILESDEFSTEPSELSMSGSFLDPSGNAYRSESPTGAQQYFSGTLNIPPGNGFDGAVQYGTSPENTLPQILPGNQFQPGQPGQRLEVFQNAFPEFETFMAAGDGRLRGGEAFPTHPAAQFAIYGPNDGGAVAPNDGSNNWEYFFHGGHPMGQQPQQQPPPQGYWQQ